MSTARQRAKMRAASARWKLRNPNHAKKYYRRNKKKVAARMKRKFASLSGIRRRYQLRWAAKRRREMLGGRTHCAICCKRLTRAYVDHCYATAKRVCAHRVDKACKRCKRDVLCPQCNCLLGMANDNLQTLARAHQYLKKWNRIHGRVTIRPSTENQLPTARTKNA